MYFDSFAAALAMEGHGAYVWAVVVVSSLVIAGMLLLPSMASRRFLREQRALLGSSEARGSESSAPTATIEEVNNAPGT